MKKSVSIALSIFGGLLVIVLLLPWLISLNQYKTMIQEKAFEATGRQILINGDVRFGILPTPYARLTDVVITNPDGAISKEFATVKALDVGVALAPLLSKRIEVTHVTVTEPAITLEVMENGENNWQFTPKDKAEETAPQNDAQESSAAISVDNLKIEKGFVRYVNVPGKSQQTVGPIDALFKLESLQGPVSGIGTATFMDNLFVRFDTKIDALPSDTNKDVPFTFSLGILNNAATADLKGVAHMGDDVTARVETAVTVADLAKILAAMNKENKAPALPDYLQGRTSLTGLLEWKDQQAAVDNLMLKAGSLEVHGSVAASMKETTSVVVDLNRVALPPEATNGAAATNAAAKKTDANLAKTLNDAFVQATGFLDTALPKNDINIVLTASQLPLPNQPVLRDVRIAASLAETGLTLQNAEVKLPGNTHVKLRGTLPTRDDGKIDSATIEADVTSDNIAAASGKNTTGEKTPITLNATTKLTREMLRVNPLNLSQKGQSVQGDILYNPKSDPVLTVAVKGSALNLDSFMGEKKAATPAAAAGKTTATAQKSSADPFAMLQGLKAKLNVELGALTFQQKTAKNITANALVSDKGLELQKAHVGDLGGMVIDATGKVDRLSPLGGASLQAQAKTPNLSTTLKALGNAEAANLGTSSFTVSVQGDDKALDVGLNGTIDQGKVAINGKATSLSSSPSFNGKIDITHPETATILRNFAKMTPTISLGAFALQSDVAYGADTIKADKLLVKLGTAGTLQGHVNITPEGNGRKIDADIRGDKLALSALMGDDNKTEAAHVDTRNPDQKQEPWSREPINLDGLRGLNGKANIEIGELLYQKFIIRDLKTTAVFADNVVTLQRLNGALFDAGTFSVQGQLAAAPVGQAHRGDFSIAINKTDAVKLFAALGSKPFAHGIANINQTLKFSGANPYQLVSSLNGDGQVKVDNVIINGLDLDALADRLDRPNSISDFAAIIGQATAGGQTPIGNLDIPVTIRNGVASIGDTTIKTQKTEMLLKGNVQLPPKQVDMTGQITFIEQRKFPPLTLFIKGPMNNPQKSFDTRSFTNFYAQQATEKLQNKLNDKIQDGLGKLLGTPKASDATAPAATTPSAAPTTTAPATTAPTAPTAPAPAAPAAPAPKQDPLKQLGNDMLKNILGGGQ